MSRLNRQLSHSIRRMSKQSPDKAVLKRLLGYTKTNVSTKEEKLMNGWLSNNHIKHTNQAVIAPYIVDILLTDCPIVIELDGTQHKANTAYDARRTEYLNSLGLKVLRINNFELNNKIETINKVRDFKCNCLF